MPDDNEVERLRDMITRLRRRVLSMRDEIDDLYTILDRTRDKANAIGCEYAIARIQLENRFSDVLKVSNN